MTGRAWLGAVTCLLVVRAVHGQAAPTPAARSFERGEQLFFQETFAGNGRTCATCHDPRDEFALSASLVQARYALDPDHPLFRAIDSDEGDGRSYTRLLDHALVRVTIPLHPNVWLVDEPRQRTIRVWRGVPSITNVALTAPYLQDGRAATLPEQAHGAILDHMEPGRRPSKPELDALATFMTAHFYPQRLSALGGEPDPRTLEPGFTVPVESPAAVRGKQSFDLHCRRCHGGETTQEPSEPDAPRFANVFVSEPNVPRLPLLRLAFRQPDGSVAVTLTPDPGRAALTGDLRDLNAFDTPSLRGVKHTAPYFHDNSANTLGEVVDHYDSHFQFHISASERDALIAYLELL
ncbi:MAG TPA: cytochrome c peroxidase [Candidatus Polarisedimenticolaceae bacterium]|nr:cytochrome c peroxidase [Candidatus Polarisedimenticolaceae bacterium]